MPARAPSDPYVLALEHTVPQPTDSRPRRVPLAIRPSPVDMRENLDVFSMCPSVESAGRRFASLDRVLRGEFPCFNGTIKALRLPAVRPAALRCLRLAVTPRSLVLFAPRRTSAPPRPGVVNPVSPSGSSLRRRQDLASSWGTPIIRSLMFSRRRRDCGHQTIAVPQRGPWYPNSKGSHERCFGAQ